MVPQCVFRAWFALDGTNGRVVDMICGCCVPKDSFMLAGMLPFQSHDYSVCHQFPSTLYSHPKKSLDSTVEILL